jgi:hypothetical protein
VPLHHHPDKQLGNKSREAGTHQLMIASRIFLFFAGIIGALWAPRGVLNLDVIETLVVVILIALLFLLLMFWRLRPPGYAECSPDLLPPKL